MDVMGRGRRSAGHPRRKSIGARAFFVLTVFAVLSGALSAPVRAEETPLYFGVLNQRSIALTARYWNPILEYVSRRSGVPLRLKMGKTAPDTTAMTVRGEFAFVYTNHLFTPERVRLGYRVIARPATPAVHAVIAVREDSPHQTLTDIKGQAVAFPSREAFLGYSVPMNVLHKLGIKVQPMFAGNQEGAMAQLHVKSVEAAAVNSQVLDDYSRRENLRYRVLWLSEPFQDLPIMANPAVPVSQVDAVRQAFIGMASDPQGRAVLEEASAALNLTGPIGFVAANNTDYESYRLFHQQALAKEPLP